MFSWIAILKTALSIVSTIANYIHEENLMDAGEDRAIAKQMAEIASRLKISDAMLQEIEAMSDEEIDKELMK